MAASLRHRGPDDEGIWTDPSSGMGMGFRRLSIIDLSAAGHQPMRSESGRYTIVFNGEIYNHPDLAADLSKLGHTFRGHSDTEIALAAFEEWGIEQAVGTFVGMFAIAVWDAHECSLWLLRDRLGIKPLYIYQRDGLVAFASELKAFFRLTDFSPDLDIDATAQYFRYLYVPAPRSILRDVSKLLPGRILNITSPSAPMPASRPYWSLDSIASRERRMEFAYDDRTVVDRLESLIREAVRLRMRADVPLGAFLSGGVDSSTVVALMQASSAQPVRTFTIGFDVGLHDESSEAAAVANYLGTDHQTIVLTGKDAMDLILTLPDVFDEPLADPSQLPTQLVCLAARREVTVAVSGDGGDELFAGYNRYSIGSRLLPPVARLPLAARQLLAAGVTRVHPETWDRMHAAVAPLMGGHTRLFGDKMHKLARVLRSESPGDMYQALLSAWPTPPVLGYGSEPKASEVASRTGFSLLDDMMLSDQRSYLPDDLLAKVDRASMAVSLEVRVPLLDHRIVEFSWRLPHRFKLRDGQSKWILRQVLARHVPPNFTDGPKVGFTVPLAEWLRGPLRDWADGRLSSDRMRQVPWIEVERIRSVWKDFLERRNNYHLAIWAVLVFEAWRERWGLL